MSDGLDWLFADKLLGSGIVGFLGPNGHGKTAGLVGCRMRTLEQGVPDLGTVRMLDWKNPRPCEVEDCTFPRHPQHGQAHPLWTPLTSYDQMLEWVSRPGRKTISMDEIQGIGDVHDASGMPYQWRNAIRKLRHSDASLMWSAPDWGSAPVPVRRVTQVVVQAVGSRGVPAYLPCEDCDDVHAAPLEGGCSGQSRRRLWPANRRLRFMAYDARRFDEWSEGKRKPENRLARARVWMPKSAIGSAYDTHGPVLSIGASDQSGTCVGCGGRRTRQECSCDDYVSHKVKAKQAAQAAAALVTETPIPPAPPASSALPGRRRGVKHAPPLDTPVPVGLSEGDGGAAATPVRVPRQRRSGLSTTTRRVGGHETPRGVVS